MHTYINNMMHSCATLLQLTSLHAPADNYTCIWSAMQANDQGCQADLAQAEHSQEAGQQRQGEGQEWHYRQGFKEELTCTQEQTSKSAKGQALKEGEGQLCPLICGERGPDTASFEEAQASLQSLSDHTEIRFNVVYTNRTL